jgi:hypothetical protein
MSQKKRRCNSAIRERVINKRVISKRRTSKNTIKQHYNSYFIKQKKQVIAYTKENGIIKATKSFELNKSMISRWVNLNEKWKNVPNQNSKKVGSGQKSFYPGAEKDLYDWIIKQKKQGLGVIYAIA